MKLHVRLPCYHIFEKHVEVRRDSLVFVTFTTIFEKKENDAGLLGKLENLLWKVPS